MKFINTTNNSVYLNDIDLYIPYLQNSIQEIDEDTIKKSKSFQDMVVSGSFKIVDIQDSRIENNLKKLQKKYDEEKAQLEQELEQDECEELKHNTNKNDSPEVIIKGHFYDAGGYAKVNRNLAYQLHKNNINVAIESSYVHQNQLNEIEVRALGTLKKKLSQNAIRIDSIVPSFSGMAPGKGYKILYTTVESVTIPKQTVDICKRYDEIWVTSDFCKEVFMKNGLNKEIFVMPPCINTSLFSENGEKAELRPKLNNFVFISLFGWSYRKGYDALLKAYLQEFSSNDDVTLLVVSRFQGRPNSKKVKDSIQSFINNYGGDNPAHIARCGRVIPEHELPDLYRACNCFVLPTRGEGFGLPFCEASLCGLPVIATNHSAQTMFLNNNNSYLVDIDRLVEMKSGMMHVHYWDNELFPDLTSKDFINRLSEKMRYVYDNYEESLNKNKILQQFIKENYSFKSSSKRISDRIFYIWKNLVKDKK